MVRVAAIIVILLLLGLGVSSASAVSLSEIRSEVAQLKNDVQESEQGIADLNSQVEATTKDILRIYQEIDANEALLTEQKRVLNGRILDAYRSNNYILLTVILDSRGFSDLWKRVTYLARINRADNELLAENKFRAEKIRALKAELASKKSTQLELKRKKTEQYYAMQQDYYAKKTQLEQKLAVAAAGQKARMTTVNKQQLR